jgi:GWxTD domain-containing protein
MARLRSLSAFFAIALFALTTIAAEPTLPELFTRAKAAFGSGNYQQSLADFDLLDANSRKPGFEADRAKLAPVILFYRGANLAALGRKDDAKEAFIAYLSYMPNASIASPPFSKEVVNVFNTAVKEAGGKDNTIEASYFRFVVPPQWRLLADDKWLESPVRYLLTAEQKKEYAALTTSADREKFVEKFWAEYDPTPGTPANEFRAEFERRVAFADVNFGTQKTLGGATERGAVFTFLGAPTYAGVAQLQAGDDTMAQLRSGGNQDMRAGAQPSGNNIKITGSIGGSTVTDNLENDSRRPMRELWYYRKNRLPAGVTAKEVRFEFITKEGYGTGVMQKEPEPMQTLGQAVEVTKRTKKLNQ